MNVQVTAATPAPHMAHEGSGCGKYSGNVAVMTGSSMSAAVVAGLAANLRSFFTGLYNIKEPSGSLIKAALIHGAQPLMGPRIDSNGCADYENGDIRMKGPAIPNGHQGFGRVQLDKIIPFVEHNVEGRRHEIFLLGNDGSNAPNGDPEIDHGEKQ